MKKLFILIVVLNLFTNSFSQTIIVVKPNKPNYMGDALKRNADLNLESAKLKSANSEVVQQQKAKDEKKFEDMQAALKNELSNYNTNYENGKLDEAIIEINKFIDNHPNYVRGYSLRAETRYRLNNFAGTIADCNKCITIFSKCQYAYLLRGQAKEKLEDLKGALNDYDKCISINNNNKDNDFIYDNVDVRDAYFNRGLIKVKLNKNGCSDLKKAEELGHDDAYEMVKKYCN